MTEVRVLIVDDQEPYPPGDGAPSSRRPTGSWSSASATSGEESLAAAAELRPDLVLMDVNLPGIDGIEATRRLSSVAGGPVVVLLSTYDEDQFELDGCGASAYVAKAAFGPDRLSEAWADAGREPTTRAASAPVIGPRPRRSAPAGPARSRGAAHRLHAVGDRLQVDCRGVAPLIRSAQLGARERQLDRRRQAGRHASPRRSRSRGRPRPGAEPPARRRRRRSASPPARSRASSDRSAGSRPGPGELRREHAAGELAQRLQRRVRAGDQPVDPGAGDPRRPRRGPDGSRRGATTRSGSTSRAMAASRVRRAASSASISRRRDSASCARRPVELGDVVGQAGSRVRCCGRPRRSGRRGLRAAAGRTGAARGRGGVDLDAAQDASRRGAPGPLVRHAVAPGPRSPSTAVAAGHLQRGGGAAWPRRRARRPRPRPGAGCPGTGVSASRRLKSASASYGCARTPYARRLASRTTLRRSGWKASGDQRRWRAARARSHWSGPPPAGRPAPRGAM